MNLLLKIKIKISGPLIDGCCGIIWPILDKIYLLFKVKINISIPPIGG